MTFTRVSRGLPQYDKTTTVNMSIISTHNAASIIARTDMRAHVHKLAGACASAGAYVDVADAVASAIVAVAPAVVEVGVVGRVQSGFRVGCAERSVRERVRVANSRHAGVGGGMQSGTGTEAIARGRGKIHIGAGAARSRRLPRDWPLQTDSLGGSTWPGGSSMVPPPHVCPAAELRRN